MASTSAATASSIQDLNSTNKANPNHAVAATEDWMIKLPDVSLTSEGAAPIQNPSTIYKDSKCSVGDTNAFRQMFLEDIAISILTGEKISLTIIRNRIMGSQLNLFQCRE